MTSESGPERKFWQIALADLERQLAAGPNGLSSAEAAARRIRYGPNTLEERRRLSLPLVLLAAGDLVPADGRLLDARDFFVNQALLTGESYPEEKYARAEGVDSPEVAEATNAAFMGSSVMNGSARLMVCGTGLTTQLGQICQSARKRDPGSARKRDPLRHWNRLVPVANGRAPRGAE